jgi:arabinofuranan 3-O-arabinosyltransferase
VDGAAVLDGKPALFLAAWGVRRFAQELGLSRSAGWLVALPYMLSPFILVNIDRTSALLMPWAGLGWMFLFTVRAARRNDWRNPALFALVVALVGGINATSILMVGPRTGHLADLRRRHWRASTRDASLWAAAKIGVLSLLVSVWWLAGLWAESRFGINILQFTESIPDRQFHLNFG